MIHWTLDAKEADFILQVLQQRPFVEVHALIGKLIQQASVETPPPQLVTTETHPS
jgi:hypothetical protein